MSDPGGLTVSLHQDRPIPLAADFACRRDEVLALVGPSGSGKTTILRMVAGLDRPRDGRVIAGGESWLDTSTGVDRAPQGRSVGMLFQNYALFPHLSAGDNVAAALGHLPRAERAGRVLSLLETVNLGGLEHRRPAALSGGQQQRVALARALARDPAVLLLDEPFSAVDQVTRRKLRRELAELRQRLRIPVLLVTHDLEEAAMLADRMCIVHHGRTLQDGPPFEVMTRPCSADVARLIDSVNLYEGRVVGHRDDPSCTTVDWHGRTLEARLDRDHAPGDRVWWTVPPHAVLLHRRGRPSRGERENPVDATIESCVRLGDSTSVELRAHDEPHERIYLSVPTHVAARNALDRGGDVRVSLLRDSIHLMPWS